MEFCSILETFFILCLLICILKSDASLCFNKTKCIDGLLIPLWRPVEVSFFDAVIRSVIYILALFYVFIGVSIVSDKFMAAIERITSAEKDVEMELDNGKTVVIRARVWNETVSNLTLMALGSSAPEILLSVIEVCGKNFDAGKLGPSTIVGSAAFNLFIIIGICILCIPKGEVRKIKHIIVFYVTATFSMFAYLWLYLILGVISEGVIDVWEAMVTFLLFPITIIIAYLADKQFYRYLLHPGLTRACSDKQSKVEKEDDITEFEALRENYMITLQEMRKKYPKAHIESLEKMTINEIFEKSKKTRAFYKVKVARMLTGNAHVVRPEISVDKCKVTEESNQGDISNSKLQRIYFEPIHYTVMEDAGIVELTVKRKGGYFGSVVYVDYQTEDGTAKAVSDYIENHGTLQFKPNETEKKIIINVVDDDIYEEEEHFTVLLSNLKVDNGRENQGYLYEISKINRATILILDDDYCGTFNLESDIFHVEESCGMAMIGVHRSCGARGIVKVSYKTVDGTARQNVDYINRSNKVVFRNKEIFKLINIEIIDDGYYMKDNYFTVVLENPRLIEKVAHKHYKRKRIKKKNENDLENQGLPALGEVTAIKVHIHENNELRNLVDRLVMTSNVSLPLYTSTWKEQFVDALTIEDLKNDSEEGTPDNSLMPYILHYSTLFWRLLFACVPPTEYCGGWVCFIVSIIFIGILTAIFGDLASSFGCTIGLIDEVTAIIFVAIGTSLPDTFASKYAAINDDTADNSVGNVTGSNAVNVYLGLGVAWLLASIVNSFRGQPFRVEMGRLGFSVVLFGCLSVIALAVITWRRKSRKIGGELGGPKFYKIITSSILFSLYIIYVILSSLQSYCLI